MGVAALARQDGGEPQRGQAGGGGRVALDYFLKRRPRALRHRSAREAVTMLDSVEAPAGEMTVVLGPGWPAFCSTKPWAWPGADFNRKGVSAFSGRMGQKVGQRVVHRNRRWRHRSRRGSLNVDDEAAPPSRNVLIEKGVLAGYLADKLSSTLMHSEPTGSAGRELRPHPHARMTKPSCCRREPAAKTSSARFPRDSTA